jgi:hypothetical protein
VNHSFRSAERATHIKAFVVALVAAIVVIVGAVSARMTETENATARTHGLRCSKLASRRSKVRHFVTHRVRLPCAVPGDILHSCAVRRRASFPLHGQACRVCRRNNERSMSCADGCLR